MKVAPGRGQRIVAITRSLSLDKAATFAANVCAPEP
jgi:hypothetical protein